jgi:hypothetical protein
MEQRPELFTPHPTAAPRELSKSTRLFYVALAELKKADERPEGISSGENVKRIEPMMKQIISAGDSIDRKDLNTLYPGLGDHFLDDAVVHARSLLDAVSNRNADSWDKAMAAFIRWQTWWSVHQDGVREVVAGK